MLTRQFLTAGHAIFTVSNPAGVRYTYKIVKKEPDATFVNPAYFISLLTGPDNTRNYTYMGIFKQSLEKLS